MSLGSDLQRLGTIRLVYDHDIVHFHIHIHWHLNHLQPLSPTFLAHPSGRRLQVLTILLVIPRYTLWVPLAVWLWIMMPMIPYSLTSPRELLVTLLQFLMSQQSVRDPGYLPYRITPFLDYKTTLVSNGATVHRPVEDVHIARRRCGRG